MKALAMSEFYYYDRVVVLSSLSRKQLRNALSEFDLSKYCMNNPNDNPIRESSNTAKYHGYFSKLDLKAVSNDFVNLLTENRIGNCTISHMEITVDFDCNSLDQAMNIQRLIRTNLHRKWQRYGSEFLFYGKNGSHTDYFAKKMGKISTNYNVSYSRLSKLTGMPVYHFEFRLNNWAKIKSLLKINHPSKCIPADELFHFLEKKYLRFPIINKVKFRNEICRIYKNRTYANLIVEKITNSMSLKRHIEFLKNYKLKNHKNESQFFNCQFSEILSWKATDFFIFDESCNNMSKFIKNKCIGK